jgi:hypothetical protein
MIRQIVNWKSPVVTICTFISQWSLCVQYHRFNIQQFYVLLTQCSYVFCVDLKTNSDFFPVQNLLSGFYNQERMSLLLHRVSCRFTKYHTTNKWTNCISFILNHYFKTLFTATTCFDSISLIIIREHI